MKDKHTPGPWVVDQESATATVRDSNGKSIARCYQGDDDARLIAAAPAMLEALRYIATLDTSQDASPAQCSAVLVAMNAIDKATK
jgi:hypothetical protein